MLYTYMTLTESSGYATVGAELYPKLDDKGTSKLLSSGFKRSILLELADGAERFRRSSSCLQHTEEMETIPSFDKLLGLICPWTEGNDTW